jgi:alkylation response protein AidB-like acyl-CoA dehydrogenase
MFQGNMSMSSPLISRDLLEFQLFDWLQIDKNAAVDRDTALAILDMAGRLASDAFLTHYRKADEHEPVLEGGRARVLPEVARALHQYAELGLFGASFPEEHGGLGLPGALASGIQAIFASANVATSGYALLTAANARLISEFGSPEQVNTFALPQIEGRWFGTMCLSEPQAGSSLGDITARAVFDADDGLGKRYRITGNKMWISGGDQDISENIVHLVLAKAAAPGVDLPSGTRGISLFIVPKILPDGSRNDIALAGLNHKMGNRGTTNCLLNFGEQDGAVGWRVGGEGEGLAQMFMMMNEARIGVGIGAAALGYRGYRHAVTYAKERKQGRRLGESSTGAVAIIDHPDVRRMLLQQKSYSEIALAICLYCAHLQGQSDDEARSLLGLLTPVAKSWPSEFCLVANDLAIQVHGGYGYTRDFDVEQVWRDNRLNAIHEGTAGIQALDLLGRKILRSDGAALHGLKSRIADTIHQASTRDTFVDQAARLGSYWTQVEAVTQRLSERPGAGAYNDATMFLRAFGHGVAAWLWLDLALRAEQMPGAAACAGYAEVLRYFYESELPIARAWLDVVDTHACVHAEAPAVVFD